MKSENIRLEKTVRRKINGHRDEDRGRGGEGVIMAVRNETRSKFVITEI